MAVTTYRSGAHLFKDRAFSEFLTKTGAATDKLAKAQNNLGFSGPLGCGRVDTTLTPAQITTLATPITLLPAIAGQSYMIEGPVFLRFTYGGTPYAGAGTTVIQYHTGAVAATFTIPASVFTATANSDQILCCLPATGTNVIFTIGDSIEIVGPNFTAGNSTLRIAFWYQML